MSNKSDKHYNYFSVRLNDEQYSKLQFLSKTYGVTSSEFIRNLIATEFDKINGSPETKKLIESLFELQDKVREVSSLFDSDNV